MRKVPWGTIAATPNIPRPSTSCITQSQVLLRPNRSTIGLQRNFSVTARWNVEVDVTARIEAPMAVRYSAAIWWRKLQGSPSPK